MTLATDALLTGSLVLPPDVLLVPARDLPSSVREQVRADDADFALTRPRARTTSRIVDAQSAALLAHFREPRTIIDAVLAYSRDERADPETMLDDAYPMLERLVHARLLVSPADASTHGDPVLALGARFAGCEILDCVQAIEDTELYRVRTADGTLGALKLARADADRHVRAAFAREAVVLRALDGSVAPTLLGEGVHDDRPYLLMSWVDGQDAAHAAAMRRRQPPSERHDTLLALARAVATAYATLHASGVVHGDVHARNVLVAADGTVRLIDFGLALRAADATAHERPAPRGGVAFFFEPEYARAVARGRRPPAATALGEQYAVASLLYYLVTGTYYAEFSLEQHEMLRQIAEAPPCAFSRWGVAPAPALEAVLARALDKDPAGRFPDMAAFAAALRDVSWPAPRDVSGELAPAGADDDARGSAASRGGATRAADALLARTLARIAPNAPLPGPAPAEAPRVSVTHGAAGVAYALYRIAGLRDDPALLAAADAWIARAAREMRRDDAFYSSTIDITREVVGRTSPYHTESGIHAVRALIARAMGDPVGQQLGLDGFVAATAGESTRAPADVSLGRAGTLLVGAMLLEANPDSAFVQTAALRAHGTVTLQQIWEQIDTYAPINACREVEYTGAAHGWAGLLYATLRWTRATATALPTGLAERIDQLRAAAESVGRGSRWAWSTRIRSRAAGPAYMAGWCNGSAGFVHLWTLAHTTFDDDRLLTLAERAGWDAFDSVGDVASVCCGAAGVAYAALELHRYTGDAAWLGRARTLAERAAYTSDQASLVPGTEEAIVGRLESLFKGALGVALLAADLARPESACFPFYGEERWPAPT